MSFSDDSDKVERHAWTRGFVNALAYHCTSITDLEEAMGSAGFDTAQKAIDSGAERQDVERILRNCRGNWPIRRDER